MASTICDELMRALKDLAARGTMTIILVEQQIERALDFAELPCGFSSSPPKRLNSARIPSPPTHHHA